MEIVISESLGTIQQNGGWRRVRRTPRRINKHDSVVAVVNAQCRQSNPQAMTTTLTPPGRTRETSRMMASREEPPPAHQRGRSCRRCHRRHRRRQSNPQEMTTTLTPPAEEGSHVRIAEQQSALYTWTSGREEETTVSLFLR